MKTKNIQNIRPFSNGSEAMSWMDSNCWGCAKAFLPNGDTNNDAFEKALLQGKECPMKYALDLGFAAGTIPLEMAERIGMEDGGIIGECKEFKERKHEGEEPEKEIFIDPDQLKLF